MTVTDFYSLTSFAIASIEDGHTNYQLPRPAIIDFVSNVKVFPAMVMFINGKAFILCCKKKSELKEAELLSINNQPLSKIVQKLFKHIPSDGSILSRKNWELSENFPILYNIVYGKQETFNIKYKMPNGNTKDATLQADLIKNIICSNPFHSHKNILN